MASIELQGLFPPIPTPFDEQGEFDPGALAENIEFWNSQPLSGVVVGGSNGEFVHLSDSEKERVVAEARSILAHGRTLIAGSGELSTRATCAMAEGLAHAGAEALLVVSPYYYKGQMSSAALIAHFSTVADRSPLPILLYNVPANTGLNIPVEAVQELARHERIVGLKDSGGDVARLASIRAVTPPDFSLLAGSAGFLLPALSVGAVGAVSALANLAGQHLADLILAFERGDLREARSIQERLIEPNRLVTARYGVPGLKAAMDLFGLVGGPVRGPLLPVDEQARAEIKHAFERAGLLEPA